MKLFDLLYFLWTSLYLFVMIYWFRFNRWLVKHIMNRPSRNGTIYTHKIVIIGDGFAEGFGDWTPFASDAGIAQRLKSKLYSQNIVRQNWNVYNKGLHGTYSKDWLPESPKGLWKDAVENPNISDAEVYIVILGYLDIVLKDIPTPAEETVNNLQKICSSLRRKGKRVLLCTIPQGGIPRYRRAIEERNKLITQYIKENSEGVVEGPDLGSKMFAKSDFIGGDSMHFNALGYEMATRECVQVLQSHLLKVEWEVWKTQLVKNSSNTNVNDREQTATKCGK